MDPETGGLRTAARLDHERHTFVLLNMQAVSGRPPIYGHAQVSRARPNTLPAVCRPPVERAENWLLKGVKRLDRLRDTLSPCGVT